MKKKQNVNLIAQEIDNDNKMHNNRVHLIKLKNKLALAKRVK